jgi:hypothetical protein
MMNLATRVIDALKGNPHMKYNADLTVKPTTTVHIEVTDTFGGEANYSWVRRYTLQIPALSSNLSIIRRIKREIGWSGINCQVNNMGDMIELRRGASCMVCFVTFGE